MQTIIIKTEAGGVAILTPAPDTGLSAEALAAKDIPAAVAWRILAEGEAPDAPLDAWRWTDAGPLGVGALVAPVPALTPAQWSFFLDLTGFRATVESALSALPKSTLEQRAVWAGMKAAVYSSQSYRLDVTLQLAAQVRAMGIASVPADAEISAAWPMAAAFNGAESLLET
ncbi:hypothetical protein [Paragemmobacter straminiformis]|uniref:Uncharacterized protein n=1 Tax=Paragemmobacter straminiformis TaxID=2045119 RepID=A0A842I3M9_9RHOB|nr:hypothetical protein [Gemmobacter straminiformis]MBC2834053.1 hypothetical protein [Gemmobacter straminiformis]